MVGRSMFRHQSANDPAYLVSSRMTSKENELNQTRGSSATNAKARRLWCNVSGVPTM